jgi:2-amino-4-hydroxy-6-hydroxymethyldihydropteridine diphosphokinase
MSHAVLSIGSNLGDRLAYLQSVITGLGSRVSAVSRVYETAPWGDPGQDNFLNAVLVVDDPALGAWEWLGLGERFERAAGRTRNPAAPNGPRTLDVDVITCDGQRSDHPRLTLPHPRAHQRAFVLIPWLEAEPGAVLEVDGVRRELPALLAKLDSAEIDGVAATAHRLERASVSPA